MNKTAFFCDTDCDLTHGDLIKYNINLINMPVFIEGEPYHIDLEKKADFADFYHALNEKKIATTAAINAQDYIDAWTPFLEKGQDVLYVAFSSALSNTFEQMFVAIEQLKTRFPARTIHYADTKRISLGGGAIAIQAACKLQAGMAPADIVKFVEKKREETETIFIVENLSHLKRGGRISGTTAVIGGILNFKPILHINPEGKLVKLTTIQGFRSGLNYMIKKFKETYVPEENAPIYIIQADAEDHAKYVMEKIIETLSGNKNVFIRPVGPVVAAHCGVGTVGLIFNRKRI